MCPLPLSRAGSEWATLRQTVQKPRHLPLLRSQKETNPAQWGRSGTRSDLPSAVHLSSGPLRGPISGHKVYLEKRSFCHPKKLCCFSWKMETEWGRTYSTLPTVWRLWHPRQEPLADEQAAPTVATSWHCQTVVQDISFSTGENGLFKCDLPRKARPPHLLLLTAKSRKNKAKYIKGLKLEHNVSSVVKFKSWSFSSLQSSDLLSSFGIKIKLSKNCGLCVCVLILMTSCV